MKTKTRFLLPKMAMEIPSGGVYLQWVRCGKENCRCRRADQRHTAYYLLFRVDGKQKKKYLRRDEVDQVSSLVELARSERREFFKARVEGMHLLRGMRAFMSTLTSK